MNLAFKVSLKELVKDITSQKAIFKIFINSQMICMVAMSINLSIFILYSQSQSQNYGVTFLDLLERTERSLLTFYFLIIYYDFLDQLSVEMSKNIRIFINLLDQILEKEQGNYLLRLAITY